MENINPGIAPDLGEDVLTLVQLPADDDREQAQWAIFPGAWALTSGLTTRR